MLTFGHERTCWKCNFTGKFQYSLFFLVVGVAILGFEGLMTYFCILSLPMISWSSNNHLPGQFLSGELLGLAGIFWYLKSCRHFFRCPKCGMFETSADETKV